MKDDVQSIKKVIITGAAGMIGQALIRYLSERGIKSVGVLRPGSESNARVEKNQYTSYVECDLVQLASLYDKLDVEDRKCDLFVHLAWGGTIGASRNQYGLQVDNIKYTLDAVDVARKLGCSVFVGAGSQAEYGRVADNIKLSSRIPTNPETGYGIAKYCAGKMSRNMCNEIGMKHIWVRILSAYGPFNSPKTMVMSAINSMINGEIGKYTKAEQMWDYIYCDDVAEAIFLAGEKGVDGKIYCIGSGKVRPMRDYICDIRDVCAPDINLIFGELDYYDKQVMYLCADISELTEDTGFEPKTEFKEGIKKTLSWIKEKK